MVPQIHFHCIFKSDFLTNFQIFRKPSAFGDTTPKNLQEQGFHSGLYKDESGIDFWGWPTERGWPKSKCDPFFGAEAGAEVKIIGKGALIIL